MTIQASRVPLRRTTGTGAKLTLIRPRRWAPRFPWAPPRDAAGGVLAIGTWLGLWWWFLAATW